MAILVGLVRSDLANYAGVVLSLVYFTLGAVAIGLTILRILPNLIDVLWPLWDSKRQALRDKAVGSIVIRA